MYVIASKVVSYKSSSFTINIISSMPPSLWREEVYTHYFSGRVDIYP